MGASSPLKICKKDNNFMLDSQTNLWNICNKNKFLKTNDVHDNMNCYGYNKCIYKEDKVYEDINICNISQIYFCNKCDKHVKLYPSHLISVINIESPFIIDNHDLY